MWDSCGDYKARARRSTKHIQKHIQICTDLKGLANTMRNLLVLLSLLCCAALSAAIPLLPERAKRSHPLDSGATWNNLLQMTADAKERDRDHEIRLIPVIPKDIGMCCVNVEILKYYLNHILHLVNSSYSQIDEVRKDLRRVARDLKEHCQKKSNLVGLEHFQNFTENLHEAGRLYMSYETAYNKAIGETEILFHYLYETC